MYAFCRKEESNENEETMIYIFLGFNFQAECVFDDEQSVFDVVKFRKIPPIDRDRLKKRFAKIEGEIRFVDKRIAHRELKNDSFEIKTLSMIITKIICQTIMLIVNIRKSMEYGEIY